MRIKKREITENRQKAEKLAKDTVKDLEPVVKSIEEPLKSITGDDESAKEIAANIAADSIKQSYGAGDDLNEYNKEIMSRMKKQYGDEAGEKVYYATANKQDRNPETFETNEDMDPGTGEDFEDIGYRDIEAGEEYYDLLQQYMGETPPIKLPTDDNTNDLPFESVRPKMTKKELVESVLGNKTRKVLKTIKVKNLGK